MNILIKLFILFFAFYLSMAHGKDRTGTIESIERNRIVLKYAYGGTTHIGFLCEPEVCKLTEKFKIGDEVLAIFGAVDGKNKLLDIRLCAQDDAECEEVAEEGKKESELQRIASVEAYKNQMECEKQMEKEIKKDVRISSDSLLDPLFNSDKHRDDYYQMLNDPESSECVKEISGSEFDVFIEICQKHGCGDNIGGGCYHIAGYRDFTATFKQAVKQCRE